MIPVLDVVSNAPRPVNEAVSLPGPPKLIGNASYRNSGTWILSDGPEVGSIATLRTSALCVWVLNSTNSLDTRKSSTPLTRTVSGPDFAYLEMYLCPSRVARPSMARSTVNTSDSMSAFAALARETDACWKDHTELGARKVGVVSATSEDWRAMNPAVASTSAPWLTRNSSRLICASLYRK